MVSRIQIPQPCIHFLASLRTKYSCGILPGTIRAENAHRLVLVVVRYCIAVLDFHNPTISHKSKQGSHHPPVLAVPPHVRIADAEQYGRLHFDFDAGRPGCQVQRRHPREAQAFSVYDQARIDLNELQIFARMSLAISGPLMPTT